MGAVGVLGYALLSMGPAAVFWLAFIAPKSFVSLLAVFSTFFWTTVMLFSSAVLRLAGAPRALMPSGAGDGATSGSPASSAAASAATYAPVLIAAVAFEEVARALLAAPMHERAVRELRALAAARGETLSALDRLSLSFAWGFGHAACHGLFLYAYALPLATGPGTFYAGACPQMSVFMTGALTALGGGAALAAAAVVGLEAWSSAGGGGSSAAAAAAAAAAASTAPAPAATATAAATAARPPLAARLRGCPAASARSAAAFLRSRRAWLSAPGWPLRVAFAPGVHLLLAVATLGALYPGGCVGSATAVLALGVGAAVFAARAGVRLVSAEDGGGGGGGRGGAWRQEEQGDARALEPLQQQREGGQAPPPPHALQPMGGAPPGANGSGGGGVRYRNSGGGGGGGSGNGGGASALR